MGELFTQPGETVKLSFEYVRLDGWKMTAQALLLYYAIRTLLTKAHANNFMISCYELPCAPLSGPSKLMQTFKRLQDNSQPPPPGYSNSVILDKAKNSPCSGHFCRVWSRYWAKHDKEVPHLDDWNWVLNTCIVFISHLLSMLLKGWGRYDAAAGKQEIKDWLEPLARKSFPTLKTVHLVMLPLPGRVTLLWRVAA